MCRSHVRMPESLETGAPAWRTDPTRICPRCPMCRRGWCDRNTDNYLECPECHVQFKDVTKADPEMHPLQALRFHADGTVEELPTYSNDDASRYEGPVYESCGYVLIPRLDVKEVVRDRDTPDIVVIHRRRPADDVRRTRPLLGRGEFSS